MSTPAPPRPTVRLEVTHREQISPALIRLTFASPDLSAFSDSVHTDRYVKLMFASGSLDRPVLRTYTALDPDPVAGTLAIEFVVHGDEGIAGPWAQAAQPGDRIEARGPGGAYAPDPEADWHLLAGDEAALPAIRAAMAVLPADAVGEAVLEVTAPGYEVDLSAPAGVTMTWVHRGDGPPGAALAEAVLQRPWRDGRVHAFVHGEAQAVMHGVRPYLLRERRVPRVDVSISGYWRQGRAEEGFREWKAALAAQPD